MRKLVFGVCALLCVSVCMAVIQRTDLTYKEFRNVVTENEVGSLILFYVPWCKHSQELLTKFRTLQEEMEFDRVFLGMVDGESEPKLIHRFNIDAYPTLLWFPSGSMVPSTSSDIPRDTEGLREFLKMKSHDRIFKNEDGFEYVRVMDDNTFEDMIKGYFSMIFFHSGLDSQTERILQLLNDLSQTFYGEDIVLGTMDIEKSATIADSLQITQPTIMMFTPTSQYVYTDETDFETMMTFLNKAVGTYRTVGGGYSIDGVNDEVIIELIDSMITSLLEGDAEAANKDLHAMRMHVGATYTDLEERKLYMFYPVACTHYFTTDGGDWIDSQLEKYTNYVHSEHMSDKQRLSAQKKLAILASVERRIEVAEVKRKELIDTISRSRKDEL